MQSNVVNLINLMTHSAIRKRRQAQSGAGMLEVLISILLVSFTLFGLAGLQASTLRYQKIAHFRSLASLYSGEMADRVRANVAGAIAGHYNFASTAYADGAGTMPVCLVVNLCTPAEVAALDVYQWRVNLGRGMAGGWGEISGNVVDGFMIRVYFREINKKDQSLDPQCRAAALNVVTDQDVRCFVTFFLP